MLRLRMTGTEPYTEYRYADSLVSLTRMNGMPGGKASKEGMPVAQIAAGIVLGGIAYAAVILTLIHALRRDSGDVTDLSEEAYRIVSK